MASSNSYQQILDEYPEYITKEQLYQICHISKKSAQNLLESGEIPCIHSALATPRPSCARSLRVKRLTIRAANASA